MKRPNLSLRTQRPQAFGGVLGNVLRAFGVRASDVDLANRWPEIVGKEISDMADFFGISKQVRGKRSEVRGGRTLTMRAKTPALALPLSYKKDEIIACVNKYFGYYAIAKITIRK